MLDYRVVTLLVSDVLFAALSLLFLFRPAWAPALFPAYGSLFLWSDFRGEKSPTSFSFFWFPPWGSSWP